MITNTRHFFLGLATGAVLLTALIGTGCGRLGDPDRIRIAKIDGEYIIRADLYKILREMSDAERPKIGNKGDYLRVLNQYIDNRIKMPLGKKLADEGKIKVSRDAAREQFFQASGDEAEQLRNEWAMEIPAGGEITPLMKVYDLTPATMAARKEYIDQETDKVLERMLGEEAVAFLAVDDMKKGLLKLDKSELEREYQLRKDSFKKLEWMKFVAIRFLASDPDAVAQAAQIRERLNAGEKFEDLAKSILDQRQSSIMRPGVQTATVMESEIENNPELVRFKGFWSASADAQIGDVIGPVYLPEYQQISQDAQGQKRPIAMPDAYIIFKVVDHRPETVLSMEEATPMLAPPLLISKKMLQLRKDHGVEVYEDQLPDPAESRDQFNAPLNGM